MASTPAPTPGPSPAGLAVGDQAATPADCLLDLLTACREQAERTRERPPRLNYALMRRQCEDRGTLLRQIDVAATATLRWATAAGVQPGDVERRLRKYRCVCCVVLDWGWRRRWTISPVPPLPPVDLTLTPEQVEEQADQYANMVTGEDACAMTPEQAQTVTQAEAERVAVVEMMQEAAAGIVRLKVIVEAM